MVCFVTISGKHGEKTGKNNIMTSQGPIFSKLSENVLFIHILYLCKFEVIYIIQTEVMGNYVFSALLWECIGNHTGIPNSTSIISVLWVVWSINLHRTCKIDKN